MIKNLIFDLDMTVYSASSKMSTGISRRIIGYCARFFNIDFTQAILEREKALKTYETTLDWLKSSGLTDVEDYFAYVHPESEVEELAYDPDLPALLESIKLPKMILTNSPGEHAEHVLKKLRVRDYFMPEISDIRANNLKGKPYDFSYRNALSIIGGTVEDTLFLDDWKTYVEGYAAIGGTAVQVGKILEESRRAVLPEGSGGRIFYIDSIYDLPRLLNELN